MKLNSQIPVYAEAVTPSDTTEQHGVAIYCGGNAGNIVLVTEGGQTVTFAVTPGITIVQRFVRVNAATTATGLVRQW
jgi:hypothetical protein